MRAMVATAYGSPDVLQIQDVPEPTIGPDDLLIEVHASAVNPVDCKIRQDGLGMQRTFPLILGFDVSGVVRQVGANVDRFEEGDEVYASPSLARPGADAELVAVDARTVAHKPGNLDHAQAAVLPLVTITAWESLDKRARLHTDETILIHGGAGGVGHIALQLAKMHAKQVITTASRPESIDLCRKLGADVVINYAQENVAETVRDVTDGRGCDVVFDTVGEDVFVQSLDLVAPHGRLVTILPPPAEAPIAKLFFKDATVAMEFMGASTLHGTHPQAQGEILRTVCELVEAGKLTPHVSRTYDLEQLPDAHRQQETGHTVGKLAVKVK